MSKKGYIYKHTNIKTGKVYIGQTWQDPKRRWRKEDKSYTSHKNTIALYNALLAHGWESFTSEIIDFSSNQDELNRKEEHYIKLFDCLAPNGYNLRNICDGRETHTEATKEKIRQKAIGRKTGKPSWNAKPIVNIEGKDHKECTKCSVLKELSQYAYNKKRNRAEAWCKPCKYAYYNKRGRYKPVSQEQKEQSLKNRAKKQQALYKTPEYQEFYKKLHSKKVAQICAQTNEIVKIWDSCQDLAKHFNCSKALISKIKKNNVVYNGFKLVDHVATNQ
jgi:group I intron endonuclease